MAADNNTERQTSPDLPVFHCAACDEDIHTFSSPIKIGEYGYRKPCFDRGVKPQFEAAMTNEELYPPTVGPTKLDITDYTHLFEEQFVQAYIKKAQEFDTLPKERLYCCTLGCRRFLFKAQEENVFESCDSCKTLTCRRCRREAAGLIINTNGERHFVGEHLHCERYCAPEDSAQHMLPEETRGKDWQICPGNGCGTLATLEDGCNHVTCTIAACKTQFCFVCGEMAKPDGTGHWNAGKPCPRYGHPSDRRPLWDDAQATYFAAAGRVAWDEAVGNVFHRELQAIRQTVLRDFPGAAAHRLLEDARLAFVRDVPHPQIPLALTNNATIPGIEPWLAQGDLEDVLAPEQDSGDISAAGDEE